LGNHRPGRSGGVLLGLRVGWTGSHSCQGSLMNPYAAPQIDGVVEPAPLYPDEARDQVRLPAYGLIVSASLGAGLSVLAIAFTLLAAVEPDRAIVSPVVDRIMTLIAGILLLALQGAILRGGLALLRLAPYRVARFGTLLAVLSLGGGCIVGLPFGLWAMLRLQDVRIRRAFAR